MLRPRFRYPSLDWLWSMETMPAYDSIKIGPSSTTWNCSDWPLLARTPSMPGIRSEMRSSMECIVVSVLQRKRGWFVSVMNGTVSLNGFHLCPNGMSLIFPKWMRIPVWLHGLQMLHVITDQNAIYKNVDNNKTGNYKLSKLFVTV